MYSPRVPYSRAHFGFKSIYHIFLFLFSLLHSAFVFFIFSCYFFFSPSLFFLCVFFFVLFNNKCTVVQRFVAISSIICCTRSWLHFIWSVCSIQLNTKHLFNSDENSNINGNHDRSVITTTAIHIYHTIYIYTQTPYQNYNAHSQTHKVILQQLKQKYKTWTSEKLLSRLYQMRARDEKMKNKNKMRNALPSSFTKYIYKF